MLNYDSLTHKEKTEFVGKRKPDSYMVAYHGEETIVPTKSKAIKIAAKKSVYVEIYEIYIISTFGREIKVRKNIPYTSEWKPFN